MKKIEKNQKACLFLLIIAIISAYSMVSYLPLIVATEQENIEVPIQDEDLKQYIGRILDLNEFKEFGHLLYEKYPSPDYHTSVEFKRIESAKWSETGEMGETVFFEQIKKLLISKVYIYYDNATFTQMKPLSSYYYSGTISPSYLRYDGLFYLIGIAEFSSDTSWSPRINPST
ncbi:hypothetical protein KEJ21_00465 [Candidatus Bathyarchaeota archaeon]|nr:hypothetical protein [Candidatus Bathyarchaeota archaeon]MBS7630034.1 hypothetical protein [Candidatus Bathyarchaeota archaeon]